MASQKLFDALPPFPPNIPTADVSKFSLSRLSSGDAAYARKLFETCRTTGFFLLDLSGGKTGEKIISEIDAMFEISKNVFDLDIKEKMKFAQDTPRGQFNGHVTSHSLNRDFSFISRGKLQRTSNMPNSYVDGRILAPRRRMMGLRIVVNFTALSKTTLSILLLAYIRRSSNLNARSSHPSYGTPILSLAKSCLF